MISITLDNNIFRTLGLYQ